MEKPYKKLKVTLMSWTNEPMKVIYNTFMNMHNDVSGMIGNCSISEEELDSFLSMLMKQPHQTVLEFVNTDWYI